VTARIVLRSIGEFLITLGLVVLLLCAYQLVWTNVQAHREAKQVRDQIAHDWSIPAPKTAPKPKSGELAIGTVNRNKGFAIMRIPRLGNDWVEPIIQGVTLPDLHKGVGHYIKTQMPGQVGNFAVAGHRATNGEPFRNLDKLRKGDAVVVEVRGGWFVYRVDRTIIVQPTAIDVLLPVPRHPGLRPTKKLLTLTTCNPRWASYQRMIVFGHLTAERRHSQGRPPAIISAKG
jgi:sortase A